MVPPSDEPWSVARKMVALWQRHQWDRNVDVSMASSASAVSGFQRRSVAFPMVLPRSSGGRCDSNPCGSKNARPNQPAIDRQAVLHPNDIVLLGRARSGVDGAGSLLQVT